MLFCGWLLLGCFFFFKQKTAYEMRISDWSSDVCSSDLLGYSDEGYDLPPLDVRYHEVPSDYAAAGTDKRGQGLLVPDVALGLSSAAAEKRRSLERSEERSVGKECVSTCRFRWSPYT